MKEGQSAVLNLKKMALLLARASMYSDLPISMAALSANATSVPPSSLAYSLKHHNQQLTYSMQLKELKNAVEGKI